MDDFIDLGWLMVNVEKVELFGYFEFVVECVFVWFCLCGWDG